VDWWNTLHQPASIIRREGPAVHESILLPLGLMFLAFVLLFLSLHLLALKNDVRERKLRAERLKAVHAT
jgi:heme exporter protein C